MSDFVNALIPIGVLALIPLAPLLWAGLVELLILLAGGGRSRASATSSAVATAKRTSSSRRTVPVTG